MNLRDNYFVKLVKYIKNVYNIDNKIKHITDVENKHLII